MKRFAFTFLFGMMVAAMAAQITPYMTEQPFTGTKEPRQGAAAYKNLLFQFHNANPLIEIYDLKAKNRIGEIRLEPEKIIHCNNANFSTWKVNKNDPFPVLYLSSERDQRIMAYRITNTSGKWAIEKLQTIYLPNKDEASVYFTNLILNAKKKTVWITGYTRNDWRNPIEGNKVRYIEMKLPELSAGDVHLDYKDCLSQFSLPHYVATQGAVFYKGKIWQAYGINKTNNFFFIINPETGKIERRFSMAQAGSIEEPEGTFVYKGKMMVVTCNPGNIYYVKDFKEIKQ